MQVVLTLLICLLILQVRHYRFEHFFRIQFFVYEAYAMFDKDDMSLLRDHYDHRSYLIFVFANLVLKGNDGSFGCRYRPMILPIPLTVEVWLLCHL